VAKFTSWGMTVRSEEPLGRPRHRCKDSRMNLREEGGKVWTGFIWLRKGTSHGPL